MAKLLDTVPTFCARCHGQYTDRRHVDFEAYYDGPVLERDGIKVAIDDLILCEECWAEAAPLFGFSRDEDPEVVRLRSETAAQRAELGRLSAYISRLEKTLAQRPEQLPAAEKRSPGRPRKDGSPAQPRAKELV